MNVYTAFLTHDTSDHSFISEASDHPLSTQIASPLTSDGVPTNSQVPSGSFHKFGTVRSTVLSLVCIVQHI